LIATDAAPASTVPDATTRAPTAEDIGARLRAARLRQGMSVRELARLTDLAPATVSRIETGRRWPSVTSLCAIGNALRISFDELFLDDEERWPPPASRTPGVKQH
jgi:transcriptional regulator with XRE-family HTH domain